MARFDVYIARVWFSELNGFRDRPIVQVKNNPNAPNSFAMISTTEKDLYAGDVPLTNPKEAGLKEENKPNRVRLAERLDLPKCLKTRKPIGALDDEDAQNVAAALLVPHKIKKHYAEDLDDDISDLGFLTN